MLTVDDYGRIRRARRDGMSIRAIARTLHHSRRKVREALACPEPRPYMRTKDPPAPKLGSLKPIIDEILKADEKAPRKQRHTAAQIFRRLQSEHDYAGGYKVNSPLRGVSPGGAAEPNRISPVDSRPRAAAQRHGAFLLCPHGPSRYTGILQRFFGQSLRE
ncbi:MAG: transposase [Phycisphaerales bacterium]|nr:MAG: transposase [Phycisphaerales bacterium]